MTIADFDHLDVAGRRRLLKQCCNSDVWVKKMLAIFPIQNLVDLLEYAEEEWYECNPAEWLEAFQSHIRIGDIGSIENNITINADWVKNELAVFLKASPDIFRDLEKKNNEYEEVFGYNFVVYTKGKSIENILSELSERIKNDPHDELIIAAGEQNKITQSRLQLLFS
jgi:2-oxo-4-hydroxy-4-carboxy-5-ureidoimidazoline decarboxylase